jgi:hypothetical protein
VIADHHNRERWERYFEPWNCPAKADDAAAGNFYFIFPKNVGERKMFRTFKKRVERKALFLDQYL